MIETVEATSERREWWSAGAALLLAVLHALGFVALHFYAHYGIVRLIEWGGPGTRPPGAMNLWWEFERFLLGPHANLATSAAVIAVFVLLDGILLQQAFARRYVVLGLFWAFAVFVYQVAVAVPLFIFLGRIS